jgi:lambda family phage minor tail protein L
MTIKQELQQSVLPAYIELFDVIGTPIGAPTFRLTPSGTAISFGGVAYTPMPIAGSGWQAALDGAPAQPTLAISNVTRFIQSYLTTYQHFVGAKVRRRCTFETHLDGGIDPNVEAVFNDTTWVIEQLSGQNADSVTFKLRSVLDQPRLKLPRGQVLRSEFPGAGLYRKS